jgi:RNA polymerase sigma-70 factor, ECF subfamily
MDNEPREPFETLVARNGPRLWRLARSYARGDLAADLYQEILMQLWRSLGRFEGRADLDTWVYRVAVNTAVTYRRHTTRQPIHAPAGPVPLEEMRAANSDNARETAMLDDFVGSLLGMDKVVFLLYLEDLSYREMADITGLTESNVGVRINRLKQRFVERYLSR